MYGEEACYLLGGLVQAAIIKGVFSSNGSYRSSELYVCFPHTHNVAQRGVMRTSRLIFYCLDYVINSPCDKHQRL